MAQLIQARDAASAPHSSKGAGRRVDDYVGERIRQRRTELGLTQEELGRALNISYQQVQKYETAANRVSAGRLYELSRELDVAVGYFFEGFDKTRPDMPLPHGGHNRAAIDLVRNFMDIRDEDVRASLGGLLKAIREHQDKDDEPAGSA